MGDMVLLVHRLPDLAMRETRVAHVREDAKLPNGDYGFLESYCDDPSCDCRRVLITVMCEELGPHPVATLNYGWEDRAFYEAWIGSRRLAKNMAGVIIDPLGQQSEHAPTLVKLFEWMLGDRDYRERFKRHYAAFKAELAGAGAEPRRASKAGIRFPRAKGRRPVRRGKRR